MENQKLENQLNLALNVGQENLEESANLRTGYDTKTDTWELIVRHSGNLMRYSTEQIRIEELVAGYAIVTLPRQMIPAFAELEEIEYIEKPKRLFPQIETALAASCFRGVSVGGGNMAELNGDGVYIAVIDSGIDYALPVFRNADGTSKIEWLWDQGQPASVQMNAGRVPEGFSGGIEYSGAEIDTALTSGMPRLSSDVTGHGTDVASIAVQGAPGSRLIIVKLDTENQESYPATTALMRAFTYVIRKAQQAGKPVAINVSFGNTYGSHDGTSILERFIDDVSEIGRNVICVGSGNEGASAGHFSAKVETSQEIEFAVGNYETELSLQIWKNYADIYDITVVSPGGEEYRIGQREEDGGAQIATLELTKLLIYSGPPQPYRTKEEIYIDFLPIENENYVNRGAWKIKMEPVRVVNGFIQMYMPSEVVRSSATRFLLPNPETTLTIPSTAQRVITVGAYQTYFGAYADFSGRGFVVNATDIGAGMVKPDMVAPGVNIRLQTGEGERTVSGTSYATPFVTAAAALLMEWGIVKGNDPYLYGEKVKAYLIRGARQLPGYEEWPNDMAGWGALCVADSLPGAGSV